jgi:Ca2+-binding RTX toxin-like protein
LYGADYTVNSTDTIYTWSPATGETFVNGNLAIQPGGNRIFETIWDGGGIDTYDLSNYTTGVTVDLGPGDYSVFSTAQLANLGGGPNGGLSRGNVFNALQSGGDVRSLIEVAVGGSGADLFRGNAIGNRLVGNAGNDTLFGEDGDDVLDGGIGADALYGDAGDDVIFFDTADAAIEGGSGTDTLVIALSGVTVDLTAIPDALIGNVEAIDLGGRGNVLVLSLNDALALSSTTDTVRIEGGPGDRLISSEGRTWLRLDDAVIGANTYYTYTQLGATLLIDTDIAADIGMTVTTEPAVNPARVTNDVNLDGRSDIVWRASDGRVTTWLTQGAGAPVKTADGTVQFNWGIVDTHADYNGDGRSDILWRSNDGTISTWLMNGDGTHSIGVRTPMALNWTLVNGHGDYNGDRKSDVL